MQIDTTTFSDRYWVSKGLALELESGFFDPSEGVDADRPYVTYLHAIESNTPCIVLLGPPGIGKTTEFLRATRTGQSRDQDVHLHSLRTITTPEALERLLFNELSERRQIDRVLFLDSLDEATTTIPVMQHWILRAAQKAQDLRRETGQSVLLRISSRTADWSEQFEAQLRDVVGDEGVEVYELAPLTRGQASAFIESKNLRSDDFLPELKRSGTEAFASRPVTLKMLINSFVGQGALSDNKVALYRRGLLALLEETNLARRASDATGNLSPEQRFAIAARVAAACVLSGKRTIWDGLYSDPVPDDTVAVSELIGDQEEAFADRVTVSVQHIRETLRSGLFRASSENSFEWTHNTFVEFLSAYYIAARLPYDDSGLEILRSNVPGNDRVVPQLREVAAWLGTMNAAVREELIVSEPDLLLASDVTLASAADRHTLVAQLIAKLGSGQIYDKTEWRNYYQRLNHPELATQLSPIIRDSSKNRILRRAAIDIAEACFRVDLIADLRSVAFDQTDDAHIRAQATHALAAILPADQRGLLVSLALRPEPDPDDEIKGSALRAVWPEALSAADLFRVLTAPKRSSFIGSYSLFLHQLSVGQLDRGRALAALQWLTYQSSVEGRERHFVELVPKILIAIWRNANDNDVVEGLAKLVLTDKGDLWLRHETNLKDFEVEYHASSHLTRRALLRAVLNEAPEGWSHARLLTFSPWRVVTQADLPWLVEELLGNTDPRREAFLIDIVTSLITWEPLEELLSLWDVPHEGLYKALQSISFIPLDSDFAKWQREQRERREKEPPRSPRPSRSQRIQQLLEKSEHGDRNAFWLLNLALLEDDAGRIDEFTGILAPGPGWDALDTATRSRVLSAARRHLEQYSLPENYLQPSQHNRPAAAGYRALRLLFTQDRLAYTSIGPEVWSRWALAILAFTSNDSSSERDNQRQIAKDCYAQSSDAMLAAISHYLRVAQSFYHLTDIVVEWATEPILNTIWMAATDPATQPDDYERTFQSLMARRYEPTIQLADESLERLAHNPETEASEPTIFEAAVGVATEPKRAWSTFTQIVERNVEAARVLITRIAGIWSSSEGAFGKTNESQQADLYLWIESLFTKPTQRDQAHFVTPIDEVSNLQRALLYGLVNRGTAAGVAAVARLVEQLPGEQWLRWSLEDARETQRRVEWIPLTPRDAIERLIGRRLDGPAVSDKETVAGRARAVAAAENPDQVIDLEDVVPSDTPIPDVVASEQARVASRPLKILILNDEWQSGHGGISTFNRDLCSFLAKFGHTVFCFVPAPSDRDVDDARHAGVRIVRAGDYPGLSPRELLARGPLDALSLEPDVVIGHDQISGAQGLALAREVFHCPYLHFIHSSPEELGHYKDRKGEGGDRLVDYVTSSQKGATQIELCTRSDVVLAVGPRLKGHIRASLVDSTRPEVIEILPGLNPALLSFKKPLHPDADRHCLISGRLDDVLVKGADLFIRIAGRFHASRIGPPLVGTKFIMRGFPRDGMNKSVDALCKQHDVPHHNIQAREFTTDESKLIHDLKTSSVFLMPSKIEGFGLTGLDAIAAGIPVIVSSNSGLGVTLTTLSAQLPGNLKRIVSECVLDVGPDDDAVLDKWAAGLADRLSDGPKAFANADDLRNALKTTFDWMRTAEEVTRAAEAAMSWSQSSR